MATYADLTCPHCHKTFTMQVGPPWGDTIYCPYCLHTWVLDYWPTCLGEPPAEAKRADDGRWWYLHEPIIRPGLDITQRTY